LVYEHARAFRRKGRCQSNDSCYIRIRIA
jgi:hypothetical protein